MSSQQQIWTVSVLPLVGEKEICGLIRKALEGREVYNQADELKFMCVKLWEGNIHTLHLMVEANFLSPSHTHIPVHLSDPFNIRHKTGNYNPTCSSWKHITTKTDNNSAWKCAYWHILYQFNNLITFCLYKGNSNEKRNCSPKALSCFVVQYSVIIHRWLDRKEPLKTLLML